MGTVPGKMLARPKKKNKGPNVSFWPCLSLSMHMGCTLLLSMPYLCDSAGLCYLRAGSHQSQRTCLGRLVAPANPEFHVSTPLQSGG